MKVRCVFVCPGLVFETSAGSLSRPTEGEVYDVPDPVGRTLVKRGFMLYEGADDGTDDVPMMLPGPEIPDRLTFEDDGEID